MDNATDWVVDNGQYALDFDGSNDYATTALSVPTSQMTFAVWAKPRSVGIRIRPCGDADYYGGARGTSLLFFGTQRIYWVLRGGTASDLDITGLPIVTNQWTHVVCSLGDAPRMIVNGKLVGTGTGATFSSWNGRWLIGSDQIGGSAFDGPIDDCMVWNRPLSISEALQLYQLGRGGMYALRPPKKYWNFKYESQKPRKSQQIIIKHDSPSFENGFAPRDGEALYPNLLKGLVGAWCPSLGVTGGILRDVSGRNNHGTLTNMDPATDWVIDGGKGALDFDGVNDLVLFKPVSLINSMSISFWYKARTITTNDGLMHTSGSVSEGVRFNGGIQYYSSGATVVRITPAPLGVWTHVVFTRTSASDAEGYLNGILQATGTGTGLTISGFGLDYIGEDRYFDGQLDDIVFYNRVLSPNEIRQIYQLGRGGSFALKSRRTTTTTPARIPNSRSSLITRPPIEPSYENGYAPRDGEPLYPNLFKGLIGAWCPSMGVTGNILRDLSGRNNHGTLTNMDPATDWVIDNGQYALDFDGANDWVDVGASTILRLENTSWSIAFWARPILRSMYQVFVAHDSNITQNPLYEFGIANNNRFYFFNGSIISLGAAMTGDWEFCVAIATMTSASVFALHLTQNAVVTATQANIPVFGGTRGQRLRFAVDAESGGGQQGFLQGQMDNITVWNRALSPSEIRQLYQLGRGGMFRFKPQTARKTISLPATWLKVGEEWTEVQPKIATGSKASLITRPPIEPSYENGFAPRDGEPLYPNLFKGLVGAWCPSMGVTGNTLRDLSGQNNHGALTNMDPATDWVVNGGQHALDFDGTNDRVLATLRAVQSPPYSISSWIYVRTLNPTYTPWYVDDGAPLGREQEFFVNSTRTIGTGRVNAYNPVNNSVSTITLNAWQFVAVTFTADKTIAYYINGSDAGVSGTNPMTSQTVDLWTSHAICQSGRFASRSFDGLMADQAIWNRTLSPSEIRQLYQLGRGGMFTLKPKTIALPTSTIWQPSQSRLYTGEWK